MHSRLATLAFALPALSQAFLIPLNLKLDVAAENGLPSILAPAAHAAAVNSKTKQVVVDCKNCPYLEASVDNIEFWSKKQNSLVFDFSTISGILNVNDHPLLSGASPKSLTPLMAKQVAGASSEFKPLTSEPAKEVPLGFEVFAARTHPGVINARLHVLSVGPMQTDKYMDIVEVNLIEDGKGGFLIYDAVARQPTQTEAAVSHCRFNALCRWRMYMLDMVMKLRGQKNHACPDSLKVPTLPHGAVAKEGSKEKMASDLLDIFRHRHIADLKQKQEHHTPGKQSSPYDHQPQRMSRMCIVFRYIIMPLILTCIVGTLGFTAGLMLYMAYSKLFKKSQGIDELDESDKLDILEEEGLLSEKALEAQEDQLPAYTDEPRRD